MQLFATGLNAWHQLEFQQTETEDEPLDYYAFKTILQGDKIERPLASLSQTLVRIDNHILRAGASSETSGNDELEYCSVETANGQAFTTKGKPSHAPSHISDDGKHGIWKFPNCTANVSPEDYAFWPMEIPVRQIEAFDVGLVILYQDGSVGTMGDPRFEDCLGREVSDENPANRPCRVTDLDDLGEPVKQVAAGGYTVAAVTEGGSLYVWGTITAGTHRKKQAFDSLSGMPNYIEVDGGKDVQEVALGESHALVLTSDGCVYALGDNHNGQLGLGTEFKGRAEDWINIGFVAPNGQQVVSIGAGPRSSFIITATASVGDKV